MPAGGGKISGTPNDFRGGKDRAIRTIVIAIFMAGMLSAGVCLGQQPPDRAGQIYVDVDPPPQPAPPQPDSRPPAPAEPSEDDSHLPIVQPPSHVPSWDQRRPGLLAPRTDGEAGDSSAGLLDRRSIPVTEPSGQSDDDEDRPPLPVPGSIASDRRCRISMDDESGWVLVRFLPEDDLPNQPACWALPNRLLAEMVKTIAARPDVIFQVSGQNTVYDQQPFILLHKAMIESDRLPPHLADSGQETATDPAAETTSDAVLVELLVDRPGAPVLPVSAEPYQERGQAPSVAPAAADQDVYHPGRGNMVVDRIILLLPSQEGQWMEAVFESDNTGHEPPLRVLPSTMLARAERIAARTPMEAARFHVSGQITEYKGRRYLFICKLIEQRDMGGP